MIIERPHIIKDEEVTIKAKFIKNNGEINELWYSLNNNYYAYITDERTDAFLVGLLILAMKNKEDIYVKGTVSEKLYYNLKHYTIRTLSKAFNFPEIDITCENIDDACISVSKKSATGFSGGIDSFFTMYEHLNKNCSKSYKLDYLTFFNVGSHDIFGENSARLIFNNRYEYLKKCADEFNLEFIKVDSNLSEILQMSILSTITLRTISAVLIMQKLFNKYYLSSSGDSINDFKLTADDITLYDILLLNGLETESMALYSTGCLHTRLEKTKYLINYKPSYKYLNVCSNPSTNNIKNCGMCNKCIRTLLTLDSLHVLNLYKEVFDIGKFKKNRDRSIGRMLSLKSTDMYMMEIFKEYKKNKTKFSIFSYIYIYFYKLYSFCSIKPIVKKILKKSKLYKLVEKIVCFQD